MTWRSAIDKMPECDPEHPFYPIGYEEWLEKVMDEPWVHALEDMIKWTGMWVGSEEGFFEELRMRGGKEVGSPPTSLRAPSSSSSANPSPSTVSAIEA
jgi:hypothetical protein